MAEHADMQRWIASAERLPLSAPGQVHVLFADPDWATYFRGLFTLFADGNYEWAEYDSEADRFREWDRRDPSYWRLSPEIETLRAQIGGKSRTSS